MKKIVLILSIIGSLISYSLFNTRQLGICNLYCGGSINKYQDIFLFFPFILFFSIITFLMPAKVFQYWLRFIKYSVPVILLFSFLISLELHHGSGNLFSMYDNFDLLALFIMYLIFTLGSIIQIIRGYREK